MKQILLFGLLAFSAAGLLSCKKDHSSVAGPAVAIPAGSIAGLSTIKGLMHGLDTAVKLGNYRMTGTVISNDSNGNIPAGYVMVQDTTGGITLALDAASYSEGDSLVVSLKGAVLANVLGVNVIRGLNDSAIHKVASGLAVVPRVLTLYQLSDGFSRYEATLVRILNATITPLDTTQITYAGDKELADVSGLSAIRLYTNPAATFAGDTLPQGATFTGIPEYSNTTNTSSLATRQILVRSLGELSPVESLCSWQMTSPSTAGTEAALGATSYDGNTVQPILSRGPMFTPAALARGFSSTAKILVSSKTISIDSGAYDQLTMSALPGHTLSLSGLTCMLRRSAAGANAYCWTYSLDGVNFTEIGNDVSFTSTVDGVAQAPLDLSGITDLQNVAGGTTITLRLYGWGFGTVNSGTFAIGRFAAGVLSSSLTISGIVN